MEQLFKNYEAFYAMLLSTTLLGNKKDNLLISSQNNIIELIGSAYEIDQDTISKYQKLITDELNDVMLLDDAKLILYNAQDQESNLITVAKKIKSEIIINLQKTNQDINRFWLDYSYATDFQPTITFHRINSASRNGHMIACRESGILQALGIGCTKNLDWAITRFKQAAYWGDLPSLFLLTEMYRRKGDDSSYKIFKDVTYLAKTFLSQGVTILPADCKVESKEARLIYVLISSIYQDIIRLEQSETYIDYSFVEVISLDSLDYHKKMKYINEYKTYKWRDESNSPVSPQSKFGFLHGESK